MLYLTEEEVRERTGFKHRPKQRAFLAEAGIQFAVDGHGRTLIRRETIEGKPARKKIEPNWNALKT